MKRLLSLLLSALLLLSVTGCSLPQLTGGDGYAGITGQAEGALGDTMHSYFFDFTVHHAYQVDELQGYTPQAGYSLLVVDLTVVNTFDDPIPMFDTDFQLQWGEGDEDYGYPIGELDGDGIFPAEYELEVNERRTGQLIFAVPAGEAEFSLSYLECFEDGTEGDLFFVYFSAPAEASAAAEEVPAGTEAAAPGEPL